SPLLFIIFLSLIDLKVYVQLTVDHPVLNNYKISGDSCYLLECRFPSNKELDSFLVDLNVHVNYQLSIVINK
ncbi:MULTISPECIES: Lrp/AsnC ligand binding domain-containing protein, partial [Exiguobacterium]|uniref:Lrp/AsnC ligand binding domain-containing protein n=1 Tax=Exiguobacterium TaxID=33986 RepID=UPI001BEC991A